jgi:hypothetical protein
MCPNLTPIGTIFVGRDYTNKFLSTDSFVRIEGAVLPDGTHPAVRFFGGKPEFCFVDPTDPEFLAHYREFEFDASMCFS